MKEILKFEHIQKKTTYSITVESDEIVGGISEKNLDNAFGDFENLIESYKSFDNFVNYLRFREIDVLKVNQDEINTTIELVDSQYVKED